MSDLYFLHTPIIYADVDAIAYATLRARHAAILPLFAIIDAAITPMVSATPFID